MQNLIEKFQPIISEIEKLELDEKVSLINQLKLMLHEVSPFKKEPVDCVLWVKNDLVRANDYNPNSVAPPEMRLLQHSISEDGYTQPVVTWVDEYSGQQQLAEREVIDGFHRNRCGKEVPEIKQRVHGYLPVVTANGERIDRNDRIASTIRHNRARGKHSVDGMAEIVMDLKRRNWSSEKISRELGMDADEVLRLSQITGLAEMFADKDFSEAWEAEMFSDVPNSDEYSNSEY